MGSLIEFNDTLQITTEQGFPKELVLDKHTKRPFKAEDFKGRTFEFHDKEGCRIYHVPPCRCFLVHNINGKWLYWGKIMVIEQTIHAESNTTSGKYRIIEIYDPGYQKELTKRETSAGKSYF